MADRPPSAAPPAALAAAPDAGSAGAREPHPAAPVDGRARRALAWGVPLLLLGAWVALLLFDPQRDAMVRLNRLLLGGLPAVDGARPALSAWNAPAPAPTLVLAALWSSLSVLGLGLSMMLVLLSPALRNATRVAAFVLCLVIGGTATHVVKRIVNEPRPAAVLGDRGLQVVGQVLRSHAMTSGHAATAFASAALLLLVPAARAVSRSAAPAERRAQVAADSPARSAILLPANPSTPLHPRTVALVLGGAAAIALSRVAVGAHWPVDITAGGALGWCCGVVSIHLATRSGLATWLASVRGLQLVVVARVAGGVALCLIDTGYPLGLPFQWALGLWSIGGGLAEALRLFRPGRHGG